MSFFISDAMAQAAPQAGQEPSLLASFLPLILIFALMYFLLIRPQTKRAKQHREMVENLSKGDEVVTNGGVLGRITHLGETFLTVEIAEGTEIKVQRQAVASVMPKGTLKEA